MPSPDAPSTAFPPEARLLFVVNPISGGRDKTSDLSAILAAVAVHGLRADFFHTTGEGDAERLAEAIRAEAPAAVVAAGGDGTFHLVASVAAESDLATGIIPLGSANGMAAELCLPPDIVGALSVIAGGHTARLDLIEINGAHKCMHLADVGTNARIVRRFAKEGKRGMWGYVRQFGRELLRTRPVRFTIDTGAGPERVRAHMVVLANAKKYGTGAVINPSGDPFDGHFEVCAVLAFPPWAVLSMVVQFFTGQIDSSPYVKIWRCTEVRIRPQRAMDVQVDGEMIGALGEIHARILPGAVRVLLPVGEPLPIS
jgi:diacylglycerol kinase (ATP)